MGSCVVQIGVGIASLSPTIIPTGDTFVVLLRLVLKA